MDIIQYHRPFCEYTDLPVASTVSELSHGYNRHGYNQHSHNSSLSATTQPLTASRPHQRYYAAKYPSVPKRASGFSSMAFSTS